eukprot:scaffold74613_cov66-Phaeocystis_antarctica.AAC.2
MATRSAAAAARLASDASSLRPVCCCCCWTPRAPPPPLAPSGCPCARADERGGRTTTGTNWCSRGSRLEVFAKLWVCKSASFAL